MTNSCEKFVYDASVSGGVSYEKWDIAENKRQEREQEEWYCVHRPFLESNGIFNGCMALCSNPFKLEVFCCNEHIPSSRMCHSVQSCHQ